MKVQMSDGKKTPATAESIGKHRQSECLLLFVLQARIAAEEGAIGLILYTDPTDYSPEGANYTYPQSWWLPSSGVQRGTLLNLEEGDPLTPGYPARG